MKIVRIYERIKQGSHFQKNEKSYMQDDNLMFI
jgi:hypothetical protein